MKAIFSLICALLLSFTVSSHIFAQSSDSLQINPSYKSNNPNKPSDKDNFNDPNHVIKDKNNIKKNINDATNRMQNNINNGVNNLNNTPQVNQHRYYERNHFRGVSPKPVTNNISPLNRNTNYTWLGLLGVAGLIGLGIGYARKKS